MAFFFCDQCDEQMYSLRPLCTKCTKQLKSDRDYVRSQTTGAILRGILPRKDHCEECGVVCVPQPHHLDYDSHLHVRWLCFDCHRAVHRKHFKVSKYPFAYTPRRDPESDEELATFGIGDNP